MLIAKVDLTNPLTIPEPQNMTRPATLQDNLQSGKPVLIVEIGRTTPDMTSSELAELAKTYEVALKGKAAALAVSTVRPHTLLSSPLT